MRNRIIENIIRVAVCVLLVVVTGCASTSGEKPVAAPTQQVPYFPPLSVMQNGNYAAFLAENESALKECKDPEQCAIALFNLGFVYCYSKSPYHNKARGILYLEDLIKGAPESPWAYHARVWIDLMKKTRAESRKRPAREDAKSKEAASNEHAQQIESAQDGNSEADHQRMEDEIRSRDETIRELNRRIEKARQIDMEIEKKQRGLLY